MCRKTQMQANLKICSFKLLMKIWKLSISCHLPLCNLAGSIWWLQEGKDLGNKGSLPNRKGRWRTLRPWHCLWIFKLFIQTTDTFFSSFMKCLLLKFFFSIILSENCFLFFPAHNPMLQILKTWLFMAHPFWIPLLVHILPIFWI